MTTKSEAAEALYRAAQLAEHNYRQVPHYVPGMANLADALDAYSSAPPDAPPSLPPAVQRVVEAAVRLGPVLEDALDGAYTDDYGDHGLCDDDVRALQSTGPDFLAAVAAYRASQPEPLSARLAKLKLGSVVEDEDGVEFLVFANHTLSRTLVCDHADGSNGEPLLVPYERVVTIIYESP